MRSLLVFCLLVALAPVAPLPAAAQSVNALVDRLDRLERDLTVLQRQVYRGETPSSTAGAPAPARDAVDGDALGRLQTRMDQLERLVRELTGQVERLDHENRQLDQRLTRLQEDLEFRLKALEQGAVPGAAASAPGEGGEGTPAGGPQPVTGPEARAAGPGTLGALPAEPGTLGTLPAEPGTPGAMPADQATAAGLPQGTPREQYDHAFSVLQGGDYAAAEQAMGAFLEANPDDPLAGNAQYWLGETHYVRGDFEAAAVSFAKGFKTYPDSPKAPDNLLKLGLSMAQLGRTDQACAAFIQVPRRFPGASPSILRRAEAERQRLGCS
ncbi:tol-pal system protein YbgF [Roseospirillum parvum]|uniref:Cell division coordinator CpoB n=1 Tax=Roseospirillum parvum TaxID=83401 RepID=A0A1G7XP90_9PROT|nr:tol-pal system protein YbgF [Roseospirillum parvum]SDG85833.1 tol-pal system protein YbgF [Roseospirillum parvum]